LFFVLVYDPVLPIITVSKLVGPHKLDMTKIFSSLGNYASDFCRDKQVNLNKTEIKKKPQENVISTVLFAV